MTPKLQALSATEAAMRLTDLPGWAIVDGMLTKSYDTNGWPFTMLVVGAIAFLAESADHHPDLVVTWPRVTVKLSTHDAGGLTTKDFDLARQIDQAVRTRLVK
ncbi:MAG TPA: 4a-hydroxytetrahydrobiopterin dehydratase [Gemmatimonadales bacterium]|nr:4a-hydroxytetrahydrobiopterin dehydratase [Gemmatimonadales bacterium]